MRNRKQVLDAANSEYSFSEFLTAGTHVSPNVIKLRKTGDYIGTWRMEGIPFETEDVENISFRRDGLNNFLRTLGGGKYAIWTHRCRREVKERLEGQCKNVFASHLNAEYNKTFDNYRQVSTELYITIVYRPSSQGVAKLFKKLAPRSLEQIEKSQKDDLDAFDTMGRQLEASLRKYGPERLSIFTRNENGTRVDLEPSDVGATKSTIYSEMLGFLGYLCNGVWVDMPIKKSCLSEYLPTSRLFFGDKNGMLEIRHPQETKYAGFLDYQDYPRFTEPGMTDGLMYGDYEFIETQSFSIYAKQKAIDTLKTQKSRLESAEDVAPSEVKDIETAMNDVNIGAIEFGEYHYSLAIFGKTLDEVADNMSHARGFLENDPSFKMTINDVVPECAWFAQQPGNFGMRPRDSALTSRNFACLSPFHGFSRGKKNGNPWGEALAMLKTTSGQPFYFNFHSSDEDEDSTDKKLSGNTFICGMTGTGKTAVLMALIAFATKYHGLGAVIYDKDRGMEIGIRALGGTYTALKMGVPTGFNPFQMEPTEDNISFCENLVKMLVREYGSPTNYLTAKQENDISFAVRTVMSERVSKKLRRLSAVYQNLPNSGENSLRERLQKWIGNSQLGWVFDNPEDTQDFTKGRIFGYDYTEFLDNEQVRTPIMAYLFYITRKLINGQPFIYSIDEFWKPLQDEYLAEQALDVNKTIRKLFGLGIYATQSPGDVLGARDIKGISVSRAIVEGCVTKIYLPNPSASYKDYVEGFKVTTTEFEIIKNLVPESRMMLVKQAHRSAVVKFDLGGTHRVIDIVSGTLDNNELLEKIRSEVGDNPEIWLPILHEQIEQRRKLEKQNKMVGAK